MDLRRYPLKVSIPRSETARSTLRFRHIAYVIEIDDCGKTYTRHRRFTNFVWLHGELHRRQIGCDLPELPPKKIIGNLDPGFVERRRLMLEQFLQGLLRLPHVIQDDALWAFLDADLATAVVPRFLCRPRLQAQNALSECLQQLERVVLKQANLFRFCNEAVVQEFVDYAKAEAEGEHDVLERSRTSSAPTPSNRSRTSSETTGYPHAANRNPQQIQQALRMRLQNRIRFCNILHPLVNDERSRPRLVELGMFGALIKLLARSIEDNEASEDVLSEDYRKICMASRDNLQSLLEGSKGAALLNFCQQDGGLSTLRRLADGNIALHQICASLLWHGLQNKDVVAALVGTAQDSSGGTLRPGLTLLGCLLKSDDLRARVLASLCIGTVIRHEGALSEDDCLFCLEAIRDIPKQLDTEELAAIERTAKNNLGRVSSSFQSLQQSGDISEFASVGTAHLQLSQSRSSAATLAPMLTIERNPALVVQLRMLCSAKDLPRLIPLLASGAIDEVTSLVVVLLDHFVQEFADKEPAVLGDLGILAEPLQRLVEVDDELIEEGFQALQDARVSQIRIRAARILIRLDWPKNGEMAGDPPHLTTFAQRAQVLEVLNRHSTMCQEKARLQLDTARQQREQQENTISIGGLTEALCIGESRLGEFATEISSLVTKRRMLEQEVSTSTQAIDAMHENLERQGIKKARLKTDIDAVYDGITEQANLLSRSNAAEVVSHCEAALSEITAQVEERSAQKKALEADVRDKEAREHAAETEWQELLRRETELAEVVDSAPERLLRVQADLRDCENRQIEVRERSEQLESMHRHGEQRLSALEKRKDEAEDAMRKLREMGARLQDFQRTLNSEIVLTDAEVDKLREFEASLQPSRPARMRQSPGSLGDVSESGGEAEEGAPSCWDELPAEQEFRSSPHFRSFTKLVAERMRCWEAEKVWVQELSYDNRNKVAEMSRSRIAIGQEQLKLKEEEARLLEQEKMISDFDGHALRHAEAEKLAMEARDLYEQLTQETAEATNAFQIAISLLEEAQTEKIQADADLAKALESHSGEMGKFLQARIELESRTTELEGRTRSYLHEWRAVELEEHRLSLLQDRVGTQLYAEADGRMCLRKEVHRLIEQLHDLDRQLDVLSEISPGVEMNASAG